MPGWRLIEPVLAPLGFDWKIGIGIVASFAAREVFVSTMSLVYNVGAVADKREASQTLAATLQAQSREDGKRVYTGLVGMSLMVFYVFALQCVSTVAVVRRETNSWKWPFFQWLYMGILAWGLCVRDLSPERKVVGLLVKTGPISPVFFWPFSILTGC